MVTGPAIFFELIVPFLMPPLVGAFIGLIFGWTADRRGLGALAGGVGGIVGAWFGIAAYWRWALPDGPSLLWFMALVVAGLVVGAATFAGLLLGVVRMVQKKPGNSARSEGNSPNNV